MEQAYKAWHNTLYQHKGEDIAAFMAKQARLMELVVHEYPQAIRDIEPEYGFHFDDGNYIKTAETDRFCLYQVLPWDKSVKVRKKGKPIVIIPPYVLGANILSFLPGRRQEFRALLCQPGHTHLYPHRQGYLCQPRSAGDDRAKRTAWTPSYSWRRSRPPTAGR